MEIENNAGVQGLAQLGRNAIERVTQLESENAYLRAANSDSAALLQKMQSERAAIKGDYDEAAHFARHFIRDDPSITPRGAIIRLGDKCTDLFVRLQQAEARLAAVDSAPVVAWLSTDCIGERYLCFSRPDDSDPIVELIAKPAKD